MPEQWIIRVAKGLLLIDVSGHAVIQAGSISSLPSTGRPTGPSVEYYEINGFGTYRSSNVPALFATAGPAQLLGYGGSLNPSGSLGGWYEQGNFGPDNGVDLSQNSADYETLFVGSEAEVKAKLAIASMVADYVANQNVDYDAIASLGANSNSLARAMLDAMGLAWNPVSFPPGPDSFVGGGKILIPQGFGVVYDGTDPVGYRLDGHALSLTGDTSNYIGGRGDDELLGGSGDNVLIGRGGSNLLDGREGNDRADYTDEFVWPENMHVTVSEAAPTVAHVKLNLTSGQDVTVDNRHGGVDTLQHIEIVRGAEDGTAGQDQAGADVVALSGYSLTHDGERRISSSVRC